MSELEETGSTGMDDDQAAELLEQAPETDMHKEEMAEEIAQEIREETGKGPVRIAIFLVAFIAGIVLCFVKVGGDRRINQTMAIALWMASLWLTELIPLVVTAFMPLFLFPLFGIVSSGTIASSYMNNTIFLFLAGMLMALTLERWNLHRRFSFKILSWCGAKPGALLFGMMLATFILSMFVSNTATALMMVPNAIPIIESLEHHATREYKEEARRFGMAVMLGIAYAANVGGMASLIGTPPNLVFKAQLKLLFPDAPEMTFADWFGFGLPISLLIMIITWLYLRFLYLRNHTGEVPDKEIFVRKYQELGAWNFEQVYVGVIFTLLAMLWIFRADMVFSSFTLKGWTSLFEEGKMISDATVGMLFAFIVFVTPAKPCNLPGASPDASNQRTTTVLDWDTAKKLPFDIIFLFGGGFALAQGFVTSGLSAWLGEKLVIDGISLAGQVFLVTFVIIWLTELTSNTATSNIMIPIAAAMAYADQVSPYSLMIPTALACSCAFCLPVATPPNMVVFSSGRLPLRAMIRAGVFLNIVCSLLILAWNFTLIPVVLNVDADVFPEWGETASFATSE